MKHLTYLFFLCLFLYFTPNQLEGKEYTSSNKILLNAEVTPAMDEVACAEDETTISVTASGDEPPYQIEWTNTTTGEMGTAAIATDGGEFILDPASAGDYTFTITGNAGGIIDTMTTIIAPTPIEATLSSTPTSCPDNPSGSATVTDISGGTLSTDYRVTWDDAAMTEGRELVGVTSGIYTATITDDNNCSIVQSVEVGVTDPLAVEEEIFPLACLGDEDASIDLTITGGSNDYEILWSENAVNGDLTGANELVAGTYDVTVTDRVSGCSITESYDIAPADSLDVRVEVMPPACQENTGQIRITGVNNGIEPYLFSIDGINFSNRTHYTELSAGTYGIITQDAAGCETLTIANIPSGEVPSLDLGDDITIQSGDSIALEVFTDADSSAIFQWSGTHTLSCDTCQNPIAKPTKTFTYQLEITNAAGCRVKDQITVLVTKKRQIYLPNVFSPNGDGFNDYFTLYSDKKVVSVNTFQIFDRWGKLQFTAKDNFRPNVEPAGWNGTFNNRPAAVGVYVYQIEITFIDGETELFTGDITLVR